MENFYQEGPSLGNQYLEDQLLQNYLKRMLSKEVFESIESDLVHFGGRVANDILQLAIDAESQPPRLEQYSPWGKRIDEIITAPAWKELDRIAAQEGLIAIGYERKYGAESRLYQFAKLFLFHPSSAIYTCPLAMTDGAARLLEKHGQDSLKNEVFPHLSSRNPEEFWTSGQWMTERTGGSDIMTSQTRAVQDGELYRLYGDKWFTSATTSQVAMTLARIDRDGRLDQDLSLFCLKTNNEQGTGLNHIQVNRLKDKLGTKALPTAELSLQGTYATLIGEPGGGVRKMSSLFNVTRIYNSLCAAALMRRGVNLAKSYAEKRSAFGKRLIDHPLHLKTLKHIDIEASSAFLTTFYAASILGKEETGNATEEESRTLRLLTPIMKAFTAKQAVSVISEVLECFGGIGYIENSGLPRMFREAQVLPIWEGTTNILALDAQRAIYKEECLPSFCANIEQRLSKITTKILDMPKTTILNRLKKIAQTYQAAQDVEVQGRTLALGLGHCFGGSLLLEHFDANQTKASHAEIKENIEIWFKSAYWGRDS